MWLATTIVGTLPLCSCTKEPTDAGEKYRATVMPKLEALARLYAAASDKESLVSSMPDGNVDGLDFSNEKSGNAILVQHEELKDLRTQPKIELCLDEYGPIATARDVLGLVGKRNRAVSDFEDENLQQLIRAKFALVVLARPTDPLHVDLSFDDKKFTPRTAKGCAILFDIEKAEALGGFEFTATNSAEFTYRPGAGKKEEAVRKDLIGRIGAAVKDGIAKRFPGATLPTLVVLP